MSVVTKALDDTAGSKLNFLSKYGIIVPKKDARIKLKNIASPTTKPSNSS